MRDFFGLAAEQMRRELLDLARHNQARRMQGLRFAGDSEGSDSHATVPDSLAEAEDHDELEK